MLKDILKGGDTIHKNGIIDLMNSINKQLDVWSITYQDRERLETERDELYSVLNYMNRKRIESTEWNPHIVPRYKCDKCGKIFYIPDYVQECVGEAWGMPWIEDEDVSPCCHSYYYEDDEPEEES